MEMNKQCIKNHSEGMRMKADIADIAIIGGGPAGLSAALNGIARGKSVRVFSAPGNYLERAEKINNYLGMEAVSGKEMMQRFRDQVQSAGVKIEPGRVLSVMPLGERFMVAFNSDVAEARTVIIASGAARQKEISGEPEFLGHGVSYCATCDGMLYRGKRAVVYGEADDLVAEANFLQQIGVAVTLVSPKQRPQELADGVAFCQDRLVAVLGSRSVEAVDLQRGTIATDAVFILHNSLLPALLLPGLETKNGFIQVSRQQETNIAGVFASGDCCGIPLQIAKAVGEGLVAAQQAARYIDDQKK